MSEQLSWDDDPKPVEPPSIPPLPVIHPPTEVSVPEHVIVGSPVGYVAVWEPTSQLRWQKRGDGVCLQQLWVDKIMRKEEWRDVPAVNVDGSPLSKSVVIA